MRACRVGLVVGAAFVAGGAMLGSSAIAPRASADPCTNVEVVFVRGTGAPPGLGLVGQAFVDSLRAKVPGKSVGAYAVDYPATLDFDGSSSEGAVNASSYVQDRVAACPNTKIVLSGYSQSADVIDLITGAAATWGVPAPMPPEVADHVAAVAVFGNPSARTGGPLNATSSLYGSKAIDLCTTGDQSCSDGVNLFAHGQYVQSGLVGQAATFAAGRL